MNWKLHTIPLAITPLAPVHIGCGEDFEPTNYVIDAGFLFHFDPSRVPLKESDRKALLAAVGSPGDRGILQTQKFFAERKEQFIGATRNVVAVAAGVERQYLVRVGKVAQTEDQGRHIVNRLEIERTAHHPHSGIPYLPGSSLKGAMRTAWLDQVNSSSDRQADERANDVEKRLLGGSFHSDPFRLVRLADATGPGIASRVVFCTNHKKRKVLDKNGRELMGQGPAARRETIVAGQLRAFRSEMRLDDLAGIHRENERTGALTPMPQRRIPGFAELAQACNRFYLCRFDEELKILEERRLVSDSWLAGMRDLLLALNDHLRSGKSMLLRVGRHSGAESVTIGGMRSIRIMRGREQPSEDRTESTTLWLAAENESDQTNLAPLGWVLIEQSADSPLRSLEAWCAMVEQPTLDHAWKRVAAAAQGLREDRERLEARRRERKADDEREARELAQREAKKATLSEQGRLIESWREKLERHSGRKQPVSGALYAEMQKLIKAALESEWGPRDREVLTELITTLGSQKIDFGSKAKEIKRSIAQFRGED